VLPSRAEYFTRWSALHGGYDPSGSRLVRGWLSIVYVLARPFARLRVPPDVVTLLGLTVAAGVPWFAHLGGRWLFVASTVCVLSAAADSLDGVVAVLTDRVTAFGAVLDSVVDRGSDLLYVLAFWLTGAPAGVCVVGGGLMLLQEYLRARATASGLSDIVVVTVWERPTRVIVTTMFLLGAAIYSGAAGRWAGAGAWAWATLGVIGFGQLLVAVRARLSGPPASR
jgi:phosphatidylglycerophosphate synthase